MKIRKFQKLQQGGQVAPAVPAQGGEDQMLVQLEAMAMEIIDQIGVEGAIMLAQMIMEMAQSAQQPVGAPAEGSQPVFRRGGSLVRRIKK